jgi:serine/threonine protein phosphatase 1
MKQLIIGDIHGCYYELQQLIHKSGIGDDDEIIAVGDLCNRGPEPLEVFEFFRDTPNARAVMGNHEWNHIRAHTGELPPRFAILLARWMLGDAYPEFLTYVSELPLYIELPDALILHGFFAPNVPLEEQEKRILLGVMSAENYLHETYEQLWYTYYDEEKPVIVGHRDYTDQQQPLIYNNKVYGIDTRCVYGGSLTGILLPDFEIISVPARRDHWSKLQRKHGLA